MIYLTSDTHFGHGNIIKYCNRPFLSKEDQKLRDEAGDQWHKSPYRLSWDSIKMMDSAIIDNINATVGQNDELRILGDFAMGIRGGRYFEQCRSYRERIVCKNVHLIFGNHDKREIASLFSSCHDLLTLAVPGFKYRVVLCHYAMALWDGSHRGNIQLYGHSHANAEAKLDQMMPDRRSMDVGVDNAFRLLGEYRPFSLEEISQIMDDRNGILFKKGPEDEDRP
jgi:calcineurin-like phosphoesterase family protein